MKHNMFSATSCLCIRACRVYVRATNDDYVKTFTEMGAEETVSDTKETSLVLASYAMLGHGLSYNHVYQTITHIRHSRYASLQDLFVGSDDDSSPTKTARPSAAMPSHCKARHMPSAKPSVNCHWQSII